MFLFNIAFISSSEVENIIYFMSGEAKNEIYIRQAFRRLVDT